MTPRKSIAPAEDGTVETKLCKPQSIHEGGEVPAAGRIVVAEAFPV